MAMVDWSALPQGVEALIARRLQMIEDFIAFRATCTSWRNGTTLKDFDNVSCPKLPILMFYDVVMGPDEYYLLKIQMLDIESQWRNTEGERKALEEWYEDIQRNHQWSKCRKENRDEEQEFMCLSKGKKCKFSIPELGGTECRSSKGWLILAERKTGIMCLFHPLTRARIPLPNAPPKIIILLFKCAVLSASPSETPDYVVMIAYVDPASTPSTPGCFLGFWKPGNETWTRIEIPQNVEDLNYYNGKFYVLTSQGQVWMIDSSGPDPNNKAIKIIELPWVQSRPKSKLVECEGRLLIVAPFYDHGNDTPYVDNLEMGEIDVIKGNYTSIKSLGSSTVFLGRSQAFSIDANRFPGILEPNSIYFSDGFYRIAVPGQKHETEPPKCLGVWVNF